MFLQMRAYRCGNMASMLRSISICCLAVFTAPCLIAQTPASTVPTTAAGILQQAMDHSGIDADGLNPWHLKVTFDLFDQKGKPSGTATLDEIWAGRKKQRREWTSPGFHQIEVVNSDGTFRSGDQDPVPEVLDKDRDLIVSPFGDRQYLPEELSLTEHKFGPLKMNCITLTKPETDEETRFGDLDTFCFEESTGLLRATSEDLVLEGRLVSIGTFQKKNIAIKSKVLVDGVERAIGTISDLRTASLPDENFVPPANAVHIMNAPATEKSEVLFKGNRIAGQDPVFKDSLMPSGVVLIHYVVGPDGHVQFFAIDLRHRRSRGRRHALRCAEMGI